MPEFILIIFHLMFPQIEMGLAVLTGPRVKIYFDQWKSENVCFNLFVMA